MGYSIEMRQSVLKKVLLSHKPKHEIAKEAGIARSTLSYWLKHYSKSGEIKLDILDTKEKRPLDWAGSERIEALIKTGSMSDVERVTWCRKNGIFPHHLDQWKKDAVSSSVPRLSKENSDETRHLKKEIAALKKELLRKDKALAETAALLVLKKKANSIWGDPEED